jgi:2-iminobutanoate/2-iminopropanoate deaminase
MLRQIIQTDNAPKAIGPYSQAIVTNGLVFCAGQIGLDPVTGQMVEGGVEAEVKQVMQNINGLLKAAGSSLEYVVKTTIFLRNMSDFARVNEIYGQYFQAAPPARSTVGNLDLPKAAQVEIEVIAMIAPQS